MSEPGHGRRESGWRFGTIRGRFPFEDDGPRCSKIISEPPQTSTPPGARFVLGMVIMVETSSSMKLSLGMVEVLTKSSLSKSIP